MFEISGKAGGGDIGMLETIVDAGDKYMEIRIVIARPIFEIRKGEFEKIVTTGKFHAS